MRIPTRTAPMSQPYPATAGRLPITRVARRVTVILDVLDDGKVRVSTPAARGWAKVVRGPHETWTALRQAMVEAQRAGHARWAGGRYELDALTAADDPTEPRQRPLGRVSARSGVGFGRGAVVRPDQARPGDWTPNPDGTWLSPKGRTWRDPRLIESLVEKRARLGLPVCYEDWVRGKAS